jgi:hypothetical protein
MKIFYRISDGSYKKERFEHATKQNCLENFLKHFPQDEIVIYADNVKDETFKWLETYNIQLKRTNGGSSAAGFRIVFDDALLLPDEEIVYVVEDDYFHLPGSYEGILESLQRVDYVSLYDHVDKYIPAIMGGNPFIGEDMAEETKVFITKSRHWKLTNSTTMTFASTVNTLRNDADIWNRYTAGTYPLDYQCFLTLRDKGRTLATPIPSLSTHGEMKWAAPLIDWNNI